MTNSADSDQLASEKPNHLDLNCLFAASVAQLDAHTTGDQEVVCSNTAGSVMLFRGHSPPSPD